MAFVSYEELWRSRRVLWHRRITDRSEKGLILRLETTPCSKMDFGWIIVRFWDPPLTQHFALSKKLVLMLGKGRGEWVIM